ncbi:hypothetical protein ID866_11612 [Astraeus odoratus]|nr:hypothetical protein ID866_11612 [Astraeus odoratus]
MFYRLSAIVVASLAVLTAANPIEVRSGTGECNTGGMYCCQSTQSVSWLDLRKANIFGIFGITPPSSGSLVGFTCSPISVGASGTGGNCVSQAVCCSNVIFNGGMNVGCSPTTIIT